MSDPSLSHILYPPIEPYREGMLSVDEQHTLYFEESGNPKGKPVVFLHGGPGGGTAPIHRRFWDPRRYRIILFDQRGCGRSTPHACLESNTTWHLVRDIESLRKHLSIDRWQVFGGSWGSTLALAYSQKHPERISEMILRGIFLLRKKELHWFYQEGANRILPDAWEAFAAPIPVEKRSDMVRAYYEILSGANSEARRHAAQAWSYWEGLSCRLQMDPDEAKLFTDEKFAEAFARIESHYFAHLGFFEDYDGVLQNPSAIQSISGVIIHGRYDIICPFENAWHLHRQWPSSELRAIPGAGHSAFEPGIAEALVQATNRFSIT